VTVVSADGTRIHIERSGVGEPLLLVPGLGMGAESWAPVRCLLETTFEVIVMEPRGAGRSDKPDIAYTGQHMAEDVSAVVDALGLDGVHLAGISMGGMIAQQYVVRCPSRVRSLALITTYAACDEWSRRVFDARIELIRRLGLADQFMVSVLFLTGPALARRRPDLLTWLERRYVSNPPDPVGFLRQIEFCRAHDLHAELAGLDVPTLVISATDDLLTTAAQGRDLAELIPGARYVEVPEATHLLAAEHPVHLARLLTELSSGAGRRGGVDHAAGELDHDRAHLGAQQGLDVGAAPGEVSEDLERDKAVQSPPAAHDHSEQ
jgi:3-oxoadipate enol-lactonase